MVRHAQDPRTRWWGRLYETSHWYFGSEWILHFRASNLLGDLKARVHA